MKKSRIFAGAALAAGIGLMAEQGLDSTSTRDKQKIPAASKTEKIMNTPLENVFGHDDQPKREEVIARTEHIEDLERDGDELKDEKVLKEKTFEKIEQIISKVLPNMPEMIDGVVQGKDVIPGGYYSVQSREDLHYQIKQITKMGVDNSRVGFRDVATIDLKDDGDVVVQTFGDIRDINCDVSSLESVLEELVKFRNLEDGSIEEYNKRISVGALDIEKATMDELITAKHYYETKIQEQEVLLTENWNFITFDRTVVQHRVEELHSSLIAIQQKIVALTQ